jgi:hypothetical protein
METIEELYLRSNYEFEQKMLLSSGNGDIGFLKEFVDSNIPKNYLFTSKIWQMLEIACFSKQKDVVKFILECDCLINLIDEDRAIKRCFQDACTSGNLAVIQYLLDYEKKELENIAISNGCREVVKNHHLEALKLILKHPKAKNFVNYELNFSEILPTAAQFNNVEAIKYVMSLPELNKNGQSYIYENKEKTIYLAVYYQQIDIIRFLVCDIDVDKTKDVEDLLKSNPNKEISKIFQLKSLNKSLNSELKIVNRKESNTKKIKL